MIPFFDGLIAEGWLLDLTIKTWKINSNDRMELLPVACHDCIGAVSIERMEKQAENEEQSLFILLSVTDQRGW
jgi:serine/threonine-protein kinase HipA